MLPKSYVLFSIWISIEFIVAKMMRKMPKYRKMTFDEMKNAIDLVLSGGSAYKASKKYGIPSNTLKVSHKTHERGYTYMSVWVVPL